MWLWFINKCELTPPVGQNQSLRAHVDGQNYTITAVRVQSVLAGRLVGNFS